MVVLALLLALCGTQGAATFCLSSGIVSVYERPGPWLIDGVANPFQGSIVANSDYSKPSRFEVLQSGSGDYKLVSVGASCGEAKSFRGWALLPSAAIGTCACPPPNKFLWPMRDDSGLTVAPFDSPQPACNPGEKPGVTALKTVVMRAVRGLKNGGTYNCRTTATGGESEHGEGRAWDIGVPRSSPLGHALANWLVKHAARLGVQSVIWNGFVWGFGSAGWREYCSDFQPCGCKGCKDGMGGGVSQAWSHLFFRTDHTTHVHVGLTWAAARSLTAAQVQAEFNSDPLQASSSSKSEAVVTPRVGTSSKAREISWPKPTGTRRRS